LYIKEDLEMGTNAVLALADERLNRSIGYRSLNLRHNSRISMVHAQPTDTHKAVQSMLREFCMVSPDNHKAAIAGAQ